MTLAGTVLSKGKLLQGGIITSVLLTTGIMLGFEQRHEPDKPCVVLEGHRHGIHHVAFAPNGTILASVGGLTDREGEVRLWDVATARARAALTGHAGAVYAVAFSPDGAVLAAAGEDGAIRLWEVASGRLRMTLQSQGERASWLCFSPDGSTLASAGPDWQVRLWDPVTGRERAAIRGFGPIAFSPDSRRLTFLVEDARWVCIGDVSAGQETARLHEAGGSISSLAYSPDGQTLAVAHEEQAVSLWNVATHRVRRTVQVPYGAVNAVAISPDGDILATAVQDGTVQLWSVATGERTAVLRGHGGAVETVAFAPDGRTLASGSYDKTVRLWGMSTER